MTNQSAVITGLKNRIKQQKASDPSKPRLGATPAAKANNSFRSPVYPNFPRHSVRNAQPQSLTTDARKASAHSIQDVDMILNDTPLTNIKSQAVDSRDFDKK